MKLLTTIRQWLQSPTSAKKKMPSNKTSSEDLPVSEREQIQGTPLWLNKTKDGWIVTLKGYRVTDFKKTRKEAIEDIWLENNGWNVIANMIIIIHEQIAKEASALYLNKTKNNDTNLHTVE